LSNYKLVHHEAEHPISNIAKVLNAMYFCMQYSPFRFAAQWGDVPPVRFDLEPLKTKLGNNAPL
jgi:hypothetical protein